MVFNFYLKVFRILNVFRYICCSAPRLIVRERNMGVENKSVYLFSMKKVYSPQSPSNTHTIQVLFKPPFLFTFIFAVKLLPVPWSLNKKRIVSLFLFYGPTCSHDWPKFWLFRFCCKVIRTFHPDSSPQKVFLF